MNRFLAEVLEQPRVFRRLRDQLNLDKDTWRDVRSLLLPAGEISGARRVFLAGMGSSLYAAYPAFLELLRGGFHVTLCDASELLHYYPEIPRPNDVVILISQSGESFEIQAYLDMFAVGQRPAIIGVTANPEQSYLTRHADVVLDIGCGPERAVASSKSYTATVVTLMLLAKQLVIHRSRCTAVAKARDFEANLRAVLGILADSIERFLVGWERRVALLTSFAWAQGERGNGHLSAHYFIGRGPALSAAWQGALTFQESTGLPASALSGGQFRHGPMEITSENFLGVVFAPSGETQLLMLKMAEEIISLGGRVLLVADALSSDVLSFLAKNLMPERVTVISLLDENQEGDGRSWQPALAGSQEMAAVGIDEAFAAALLEIPVQLLAYGVALARGREPGMARVISKVTARE